MRDGRARHLVGRLGRGRPGEPPDDPALLVDGDQERLAARARRLLQLGRDGRRGVAREPAVAEEHDAAHLPVADARQEPPARRRRERSHHRLGRVREACDGACGVGRFRRSGAGPGRRGNHRDRGQGDETDKRPEHLKQGSPGFDAFECEELPGCRPGLDSAHGPGARIAGRVRASARGTPAADRRRRRGGARGTGGVAGEALDQARVEGLGAPPGDSHDRPDDARRGGHAGEGRSDRVEGATAGSVGSVRASGRRGVRLSEPRARGA